MWVRGLKLLTFVSLFVLLLSHPMWVRGLKLIKLIHTNNPETVAPHVGAWIETVPGWDLHQPYIVAPHVGAWIETPTLSSHQTRNAVAPHVGAWIETEEQSQKYDSAWSHPMWVRGLKQTEER